MWHECCGELPLTPYWFDLLYLKGGSLLDEPQARRFGNLVELETDLVAPSCDGQRCCARRRSFSKERSVTGTKGMMAKSLRCCLTLPGGRGQSG